MESGNGMELSYFPGKVASVYLLTDRNYAFKSSVILDFLYQLFTAWVEFRVVTFVPGTSSVSYTHLTLPTIYSV